MPVHSTEWDWIISNKKCPRNLGGMKEHYNDLYWPCGHSTGCTISIVRDIKRLSCTRDILIGNAILQALLDKYLYLDICMYWEKFNEI